MTSITVIVCTWNRAVLLQRTLESMRQLIVPEGLLWEILVVNNNSNDSTDEVIKKYEKTLPLRRLFEPVSGKSRSANRAIGEASGELLLWTDDDVIVDKRWLVEYADAYRKYPEASFFGGTVDPLFESEPPTWITRNLDILQGIFAIRQFGSDSRPFRPLVPLEMPFGANMAIPRTIHQSFCFNTELGPARDSQIRGEEVDLVERLVASGLHGVWVGAARVQHFIPACRLSRKYVAKWYFGIGRTIYRLDRMNGRNNDESCPKFGPFPRYLLRRVFEKSMISLVLLPWHSKSWLRAFEKAWITRGMLFESAHQDYK